MPAVWISTVVVECDGCGFRLGQGHGCPETYGTAEEAWAAARHAGWSIHPDGSAYCQEGEHA